MANNKFNARHGISVGTPAIDVINSDGQIVGELSGNASTATALSNSRTIAITGDISYTSEPFNGTSDVTGTATLANSGVTAGVYGSSNAIPVITVDSKGRLTLASTTSLTVPTLTSQLTNDSGFATTGYVDTAVSNLVASSPAALDTLNELAAALGNDANFAATTATSLGLKALKTTAINAGTGLIGGGDLSANRTLALETSGVTAGTYNNVTVDVYGRATAGSNTAYLTSVIPSNFASQTANTVLAAPNGSAGAPTFRAIVSADIPTLNQNTTGTAATITGVYSGTITSSQITTGLGFTPYNATNPSGYTTNTGTVTSVAALTLGTTGTDVTSTVATGTTTPVITLNIPTASASNRGALSATDWSTFNAKAPTASPTFSGTTTIDGAFGNIYLTTYGSIFVDGDSTNNIVQTSSLARTKGGGLWSTGANTRIYSVDAIEFRTGVTLRDQDTPTGGSTTLTIATSGNITSTGTVTANGVLLTGNTGTVTSVAALTLGTTGTDVTSTVATGTTTPVITLNIPTASATNRGALSAADWTTFNNKQPAGTYATGTGTASGTNTGDNAVNTLYSGLVSNATHTGDVTGSTALTLATVNANVGTWNNVTVNGKGLVTAGSNVAYLTAESDTLASVTTRGNTATAIFISGESRFYNGTYVDPDPSFGRAIKVGALGIAVLGGIKTDTLTASGTIAGSNLSGTNTGDNPGVTSVAAVTPIVSSGGTTPSISHATSGASAGTYNNVTVNTFGHVTAGSNTAYLTTLTDTLATVTARGATTSTASTFSGGITHSGLTMTAGTNVDQIYTASDVLTLTTAWQDTSVNAAELATGSYMVQVYADDSTVGGGQYMTYYTGIMSWYSGDTNEASSDEIVLHRAGHASTTGNIFLRVLRTFTADLNNMKLQIAGITANTGTSTYTYKFRRLI